MIAHWIFSVTVSALVPGGSATLPVLAEQPGSGVEAVLPILDKYPIVLLGEVHWNSQQHRFIQKLLRDPRLPGKVDDIAIEAGNSLYQPLIDRYVNGEDVPRDSLQLAWRNAAVPLAWDRPIYSDIYDAVRAINAKLSGSKRIRLIALDPPIEWKNVNKLEDFPRIWGYRDPVWFETLEREVLSKNRRVLVIAGGLHILRRDPPDFQPKGADRFGLGDALAQRYPSRVFRIYPATGSGKLARAISGRGMGSFVRVAGTTLGSQSSQILWPSSVTMFRTVNGKRVPYTLEKKDYPALSTLIDAILYYGSDTTTAPLPVEQYRDCAYVTELRRRNALMIQIFGMDQAELITSLARQAKAGCEPAPSTSLSSSGRRAVSEKTLRQTAAAHPCRSIARSSQLKRQAAQRLRALQRRVLDFSRRYRAAPSSRLS